MGIIEWMDSGKICSAILDENLLANRGDELRDAGFAPKIVRIMKVRNTILDILDQELLLKMQTAIKNEELNGI